MILTNSMTHKQPYEIPTKRQIPEFDNVDFRKILMESETLRTIIKERSKHAPAKTPTWISLDCRGAIELHAYEPAPLPESCQWGVTGNPPQLIARLFIRVKNWRECKLPLNAILDDSSIISEKGGSATAVNNLSQYNCKTYLGLMRDLAVGLMNVNPKKKQLYVTMDKDGSLYWYSNKPGVTKGTNPVYCVVDYAVSSEEGYLGNIISPNNRPGSEFTPVSNWDKQYVKAYRNEGDIVTEVVSTDIDDTEEQEENNIIHFQFSTLHKYTCKKLLDAIPQELMEYVDDIGTNTINEAKKPYISLTVYCLDTRDLHITYIYPNMMYFINVDTKTGRIKIDPKSHKLLAR